MSQMSKDITPSCPRSETIPDCSIQGHVPFKYQHCLSGTQYLQQYSNVYHDNIYFK